MVESESNSCDEFYGGKSSGEGASDDDPNNENEEKNWMTIVHYHISSLEVKGGVTGSLSSLI